MGLGRGLGRGIRNSEHETPNVSCANFASDEKVISLPPDQSAMSCLSTAGSTLCPHFANRIAYLPIQGAADVTAFDDYVRESASTNISAVGFAQAMTTDEGCTGWNGTGLRYHLSAVCSVLVFNGAVSCANDGAATQTNMLCASTMTTFIDSWFAVINNTAFCPDGGNAANLATYIASFTESVKTLPSSSAQCVSFERRDAYTCGFGSLAEAMSYCSDNPSDACCRSVSGDPAAGGSGNPSQTTETTAAGSSVSDSPAVSSTTTDAGNATLISFATAATSTAPATSAANANSSGSSSSSAASSAFPGALVAGILGAVVVFVAIAIAVICCVNRRRRRRSQLSDRNSVSPSGSPAAKVENEETVNMMKGVMVAGVPPVKGGKRANYDYNAARGDEMDVAVGDLILVKMSYDDGWATGLNTMTMQEGFFPLDVLEASSNSRNRRSKFLDFNRRSSSAKSDSSSSMYIAPPSGSTSATAVAAARSSPATGKAAKPVAAKFAYSPLQTSLSRSVESERAVVGAAAAFIEVAKIGSDEVVADFLATKPDEVTVEVGDRVLVTKSFDDGWCFGIVLSSQLEGFFPYDCLASYARSHPRFSNSSSTGHSPRNSSVSGKPHKPGLLVLQDFLPAQNDELALKTGDRILVEKTFDDGWASGYNIASKEKGMFPMNYVAGLSHDDGLYRVSVRSSSYRERSTYTDSDYMNTL
ncbi:Sorbin and SH3 domain-containing protein 2 [Entophlyctis luteolus]|nr:Sorbin and SH3 domain-containing protein 2 [Entophlyctis luteolus]